MRPYCVLAAGAVVYGLALTWAATTLPGTKVPLHINAAGTVDRVGSRAEALTALTLPGVLVLAIGLASIVLVQRAPLRFLNIPHRGHWTAPHRQQQVRRMLATDVAHTMGGTLLFTAFIPVAVAVATTSGHLSGWLIGAPTIAFVVAVVAWSIWLATGPRYRPAPDNPPRSPGTAT